MKFTVVYLPSAEEQLAELWLKAEDQEAFAGAANEIERMLASNPLGVGESRVASLRIVFEPPLAVVYDVREADSLVKVWAVWAWKT
jgi:hypothetical protein